MRAQAVIDVESASDPKKEVAFNPEKIINKFIEKSQADKNPLFNAVSIGIDAANGKLPKQETLKEL